MGTTVRPITRKQLNTMARQSIWPGKVAALVQGGNVSAAIAQIKVAPSVKDLQQLRTLLLKSGALARHRDLSEAVDANVAALSAPRLHRAP